MIRTYKIKKYFWSLFSICGVVLFWAGIWDGLGGLAYLQNPLISLAIGTIILIIIAFLFKEHEFFGGVLGKKTVSLYKVGAHHQKENFEIRYYDRIKRKNILLNAKAFERIEKDSFLVFKQQEREVFIPIHRVKEILYKGKPWRA